MLARQPARSHGLVGGDIYNCWLDVPHFGFASWSSSLSAFSEPRKPKAQVSRHKPFTRVHKGKGFPSVLPQEQSQATTTLPKVTFFGRHKPLPQPLRTKFMLEPMWRLDCYNWLQLEFVPDIRKVTTAVLTLAAALRPPNAPTFHLHSISFQPYFLKEKFPLSIAKSAVHEYTDVKANFKGYMGQT